MLGAHHAKKKKKEHHHYLYCNEESKQLPLLSPISILAMDALTRRECVDAKTGVIIEGLPEDVCPPSAAAHSHAAKSHQICLDAGGACSVLLDGFYPVATVSVVLGAVVLLWLRGVLPRLDELPVSSWHAPVSGTQQKKKHA